MRLATDPRTQNRRGTNYHERDSSDDDYNQKAYNKSKGKNGRKYESSSESSDSSLPSDAVNYESDSSSLANVEASSSGSDDSE